MKIKQLRDYITFLFTNKFQYWANVEWTEGSWGTWPHTCNQGGCWMHYPKDERWCDYKSSRWCRLAKWLRR